MGNTQTINPINTVDPLKEAFQQKQELLLSAAAAATVDDTTAPSSTRKASKRMLSALSAKQETTAPQQPRLGSGLPKGFVGFPSDPSMPNSGAPSPDYDPAIDGTEDYNFFGRGKMNRLMDFLKYINYHPTDPVGYLNFAKYIANLTKAGQIDANVTAFLNKAGTANLIQDGLVKAGYYAFYKGYDGLPPGMASYQDYLTKVQNALSPLAGSNNFIDSMRSQLGTLLAPANLAIFQANHVAANGDLIWNQGGNTYDWTTGGDFVQFIIKDFIGNTGVTGTPDPDIDYLNDQITSLMTEDIMGTIESVWKEFHDPGLVILAFMTRLEGSYLGQESGNADIMDQQHDLSKKLVEPIQDIINTINSWKSDGSGPTDPQSADDLRNQIRALIDLIHSSNQFSGLSDSVDALVQTLKNTSLTYTIPDPTDPTGKKTITETDSLYNVLITGKHDDGTAISDKEAAAAMKQGLTPDPAPIPSGGGDPSPVTPNTSALQAFLGSISSISSSISSTSNQLTTMVSQIEQLHQAILKLGTGVVDPKEGLNAVTMTAIQHQAS